MGWPDAYGYVIYLYEQLPRTERWMTFLDYAMARITLPAPEGDRQNSLL